jgi:hypothetical protein
VTHARKKAVIACAALVAGGAAAQNSLGMAELKALITGNTVHAQNLSNTA